MNTDIDRVDQRVELPATLNLVLNIRIVAFHAGFEEGGVSEDEYAGGTNQPEEGPKWRGEPEHGDTDNEETGVKVFLCNSVFTKLGGVRSWMR